MKQVYTCSACIIVTLALNATAAYAGYWERDGVCATFEKTPEMRQTQKLSEAECVQIQASGTGVFQQDFMREGKVFFSVMAENYRDTSHLEYQTDTGPAFYSTEALYSYKSCFILPKDAALLFQCFRPKGD